MWRHSDIDNFPDTLTYPPRAGASIVCNDMVTILMFLFSSS
jgi:hypothetical protein